MLQHITTLLYISGEAIEIKKIAELLNAPESEIVSYFPEIQKQLNSLGLDLLLNNNEVSIVTQSTYASVVEKYWKKELEGELTPATLQVLTLVAYLDNPTREEISYIRGVQSSQSIRTLTVRGLISRTGEHCSLTTDALKSLGIARINELPEYEKIHNEFIEKLKLRTL